MDSKQSDASTATDRSQKETSHESADDFRPVGLTATRDLWEDVTDVFRDAREQMDVGELIHLESFNLQAAMSAIELMDPKMDIGFGEVRNVSEVVLPTELSDAQVIGIMDQLLVCLMSWLDGHTLPQTVFSCVYAQRIYQIPRFELFSFMRVLLATMDTIINLVLDEKVADDEDFMASTYGFNLQPLCSDPPEEDGLILRKILQAIDNRPLSNNDSEKALANAISLRVRFQVELYRTMQCLSGFSCEHSLSDASLLLTGLKEMATDWISYTQQHDMDRDLIDRVFDSSINRHLMTSSPPRTAPLFIFDTASDYLQRLLHELSEVVELETYVLPLEIASRENHYTHSQRHSLHIAIHSIAFCSSKLNPSTLTRSVLSRIMIPDYSSSLFGHEDADFRRLIATDMGLMEEEMTFERLAAFGSVREGMLDTFKCLCRNRSRQRRVLLRILRWWDHYAFVAFPTEKNAVVEQDEAHSEEGTSRAELGESQADQLNTSGDRNAIDTHFGEMHSLQVVAYEVSARLMIQHWLLGFECDLYQEYEYAAVFFYVGYVLTTMANATTSLASKGQNGASLLPLRFALYTMDEARLWMCRALHAALAAFSRGNQWDYSCGRGSKTLEAGEAGRTMFGSEELWYEQRFGVVMGLVNGPAYADYASFLTFKKVQEESLLARGDGTDTIMLLLKDAAKGFLVARRTLETAKKTAAVCPPNNVTEEILQIARVAVENSLVLSHILQTYMQPPEEQTKSSETKHHVSFNFSGHRHFPVIKVTPL